MTGNKDTRSLTRRTYRGLILLCLLLCLSGMAAAAATARASSTAATLQVNSTLDEVDADPGDGACASTPSGLCTLRAAVQEANALPGADTINLPAGIFTLTIPGRGEDQAASGDLDLRESVTLQGAGATSTIVNANGIDRGVQVFSTAVVTLKDLAVQGGDSGTTPGGGLYNNGGQVTLQRVRVVDNRAPSAAGIHNTGSLTAHDTTIAGNQATQYAGGLLNTGSLTLERVTVSGNTADTNGGGLYLHSSDPLSGQVTILNSTISGNQARAFMGGGIWVYYQTELWVTNSTISGNSAGQGGGIFNYHQQGALAAGEATSMLEGNIHLLNTLLAGNTFANCGRSAQTSPIHSLGGNLDSGTSCEFNTLLGDQMATDPLLGALQDNGGFTQTQALAAGSPAIDAGEIDGCPATDQRGVTRPQGAGCDSGAYEHQAGMQGAFRQYIPLVKR